VAISEKINTMGYYWSMGISFDDKPTAENFQAGLEEINLSDGRSAKLDSHILLQTSFNNLADYVVEIFPKEMEIDGERKNLNYPYFNEIKNQLYRFIRKSEFDFNIAFFEFEGADKVTNENIISWINEFGIGEIQEVEPNDNFFDPRNYSPKRYFDGLILSNNEFSKLKPNYAEFKYFKENYVWLPI
jgi:hypothetical protein